MSNLREQLRATPSRSYDPELVPTVAEVRKRLARLSDTERR